MDPIRGGRFAVAATGVADSRAGFSLVEVLVSLALLSVVVIGILPLFTRSMSNNVEGDQLARVTNHARRQLEQLMILPFDDPRLTVPNGSSALTTRELYSSRNQRWYAELGFPAGEEPAYSRITRVRQFSVTAVEADFELEDDEALAGGTASALVHLKEIEVRVTSGRPTNSNTLGVRKAITVRTLRSS